MKRKLDTLDLIAFKSGSGYEVIFEKDWFENNPRCHHGPMLLFERYSQYKKVKSFYACAASRDRKSCTAYLEKHEKDKKKHFQMVDPPKLDSILYDEVAAMPAIHRTFCIDCQKFLKDRKGHNSHELRENVDDTKMLQPSSLYLTAMRNKKSTSQYFLSDTSTDFLFQNLSDMNVSHVICIGMPRLHEHIHFNASGKKDHMKSFLLDIDSRYLMFWAKDKFARFNMFNRYFFDEHGENELTAFIKSCTKKTKLAIVLDPPFGGLVTTVGRSVRWVLNLADEQIVSKWKAKGQPKIFWLFPFFQKRNVCEFLPQLSMLDYMVGYDNKKPNSPSPVRIFTNVPNINVPLGKDLYRFCKPCSRYVLKTNRHCKYCKTCPSVSGKTYRHCKVCATCVRPGLDHCKRCNRCALQVHNCQPNFVPKCRLCGEEGHAKHECPSRVEEAVF